MNPGTGDTRLSHQTFFLFCCFVLFARTGVAQYEDSKRVIKVLIRGHRSASGGIFYVALRFACHSKGLSRGRDIELKGDENALTEMIPCPTG